MEKTALLLKIKALAERGVGGEADNAEALLSRLMEKYDISEDELDETTRKRHDFEYHGKEQEKLLRQVVYKVTGGYANNPRYTASGRMVKTRLAAECTPAEKVEIEYLFDFYKRLWERERYGLQNLASATEEQLTEYVEREFPAYELTAIKLFEEVAV